MTSANPNPVANQVPADPQAFRCVIVAAEWNNHITGPMTVGALEALRQAGVPGENVSVFSVPGTIELTYGARMAIERMHPSAVIVIGCVIRGETPHFDYVCQSVTQGVTLLNAEGRCPVIFGVVTTENEQQALDRAGGRLGNKGTEAALTAIAMSNLTASLPE